MTLSYSASVTDIANLALVSVLAAATIFYAKRTHDMVAEMREARRLQLFPKLKLAIKAVAMGISTIRVINIGVGPAINIEIEILLGQDYPNKLTTSYPVLGPREDLQFAFPEIDGNTATNEKVAQKWGTFSMKASYFDSLGNEYFADETFDYKDYKEKRDIARALMPRTPLEEISDNLKKIASKK